MRDLDRITVHHSASSFGNVAVIDGWHRERNMSQIGYHFVILNGRPTSKICNPLMDGVIDKGRDVSVVGAHDRGENRTSIGVCLIGHDVMTWSQIEALHRLVQSLRSGYGEDLRVVGHCEDEPPETPTECPGKRIAPNVDLMREWVALPAPDPAHEFARIVCQP